jgi:hypothetical protein
MANLCPHCGLPSSTIATSGHDTEAVIPGGAFVAQVHEACVFSDAEELVPILVAMRPERLTGDARLRDLSGDDFLIPGLPEDRVVAGEAVLVRFRGAGRLLPLPALLMGSRPPAAELVWSWFREAFQGLSRLHDQGLVHGRLDENLFILRTHDGPGPAVGQRLHLLVPSLSAPDSPDRLKDATCADLRALCGIFSRMITDAPWQRGQDEFRQLLQLTQEDPGENGEYLAEQVMSCQRMAQLEPVVPAPTHRRLPWKKPLMIFLVLFGLSIVATRLFTRGGPRTAAEPPPPALLKPPAVTEPVVERTRLRWDRDFPLHRLALEDQVLLYLSPSRLPELEFILEAAGLLGFTIPAVARNVAADSVIQLRLAGEGWRQRLTLSMTRSLPETVPADAPAPKSAPEPPRWQAHVGASRLLKPDAVSPPPLLLGELGALLVQVGFDPEQVERERLVLLMSPPTQLAPRHTVWHQFLGGVRPSHVVLRLATSGELLVCLLSFERDADARGAATFLGNLLQTSGLPERDLVQLEGSRVQLRLNLGMLAERWKAAREPAVLSAPTVVDVPPPPVPPPGEEPPVPHKTTMEFLAIPDH